MGVEREQRRHFDDRDGGDARAALGCKATRDVHGRLGLDVLSDADEEPPVPLRRARARPTELTVHGPTLRARR